MKLIITEEQLRLIIENEGGGKLFNIPGEFLRIAGGVEKALKIYNDKKGIKGWDGIKIDGYLNLNYFASQGDSINDLLDEIVYVTGDLVLPVGDYKNSFNKLKVIEGDLRGTDTWNISLPELEYVNGDLGLNGSGIKELPKLKEVGGNLYLTLSDINSLPELEYVGSMLALRGTKIESLPKLNYVDSVLVLSNTPLSKTTTEEELRNKIDVGGEIRL
jgi:hypothetical protein